jgi:hypothetical protein
MQIAHRISEGGTPQARSIILDGVVSTAGGDRKQYGRMSFRWWGINAEHVGKDFFDQCGLSAFCSKFLGTGGQPFTTLVALFDKLEKKTHCSRLIDVGMDTAMLKQITGTMLTSQSYRWLLAPFIYRLDRCNKHDEGFVLTIMNLLFGENLLETGFMGVDQPLDHNDVLYDVIKYSELWEDEVTDVTLATLQKENAGNHFSDASLHDWLLSMVFAGYTSSGLREGKVYTCKFSVSHDLFITYVL